MRGVGPQMFGSSAGVTAVPRGAQGLVPIPQSSQLSLQPSPLSLCKPQGPKNTHWVRSP